MIAPLYGLVLAGGRSRRMGVDKAAIPYGGRPQLARTFDLLSSCVTRCFVSVRKEQCDDPLRQSYPQIVDMLGDCGPASGLLAAHGAFPEAAWLVLACDLPLMNQPTLAALINARDARYTAVAFRSLHDGLAEPLCTIWEPAALDRLHQNVAVGVVRPRDVLAGDTICLLPPPASPALENINTPAEFAMIMDKFGNSLDLQCPA
ncbi:NTP transferase domain-containing protein [Acetobacter sicerae]|uniref:Molybdenum cofactor guanylyltransferase n=1 Tax=Acetobacter sicerae TaxID=85325 RepID=A0ABS8VU01_9PROT|nr:NTP transferase domain-containing protein [Acetobacter sicerae]MCE0744135.1 NTP transferase domain-containing protein [Acetobacter sicerae]